MMVGKLHNCDPVSGVIAAYQKELGSVREVFFRELTDDRGMRTAKAQIE